MVSLNSELQAFYDDMNSEVSTLTNKYTKLSDALNNFKRSNTSFSENLSVAYKGSVLKELLQNIEGLNSVIDILLSGINEKLEVAIADSKTIIQSTKELISLKNTINSKEVGTTVEEETTTSSEEQSFHYKQGEILKKLQALKKMDGNIDMGEYVDSSGGIVLSNLTPGTYKEYKFTASNGVTIDYYAYIPDNIETVEGMPIHMHLWPSRQMGPMGYYNVHGLPRILYEGGSASGVVICPKMEAGEVYDAKHLDALKELSDSYVETYKCDANRISVSGHGGGGQAAINFATKYPQYFSKVVSLYGWDTSYDYTDMGLSEADMKYNLSLNDVTLIRCTGGGDTLDQNSINYTNKLYASLQDCSDVDLIDNPHYIYGDDLFSKPFTYNGKTYENMLEYCLAQEREPSESSESFKA